jgi:hypothetical protein
MTETESIAWARLEEPLVVLKRSKRLIGSENTPLLTHFLNSHYTMANRYVIAAAKAAKSSDADVKQRLVYVSVRFKRDSFLLMSDIAPVPISER